MHAGHRKLESVDNGAAYALAAALWLADNGLLFRSDLHVANSRRPDFLLFARARLRAHVPKQEEQVGTPTYPHNSEGAYSEAQAPRNHL